MKLLHQDKARLQLLEGVKQLYLAVKSTMGPEGRNVLIEKDGQITLTHDGVTVAKSLKLKATEDKPGITAGAEFIKQAASRMNDLVGDGTTTVTVLTYHLIKEANKLITAGYSPMKLSKEITRAAEHAASLLLEQAEAIKPNTKRLEDVATISAEDPEMGKIIAEVVSHVGKDGVVAVEASQGFGLSSELVNGYELDAGYVSPHMVTNEQKQEAVLESPAILVTDKKLLSISELVPLLDALIQTGKRELLIISDGVEGEALANLVVNKIKGNLTTVAVLLPSYFKDTLEDVAALTGATLVSNASGISLQDADLSLLGSARRVIVTQGRTTVIEGGGDIKSLLKSLTDRSRSTTDPQEKTSLEHRVAALSGKVAVIKVGGATETEIEEKKFRVDDAVAASKAALADGIVPGGGVALLNLSANLGERTEGDKLLCNALKQPFNVLVSNAGESPEAWVKLIQERPGFGIDVSDPKDLIDMKKHGIIDPALVSKEAILTSAFVASTAITMGAMILDEPEAED